MPILVEVGLSRKVARNFASDGVSINVRAEIDHSLLSREGAFLQEVAALYGKAKEALDRQLGVTSQDPVQPRVARAVEERRATTSQMRALRAMTQRIGVDLSLVTRSEVDREPDQLTLAQASRIIDSVKRRLAETPAGDGASTGRASR